MAAAGGAPRRGPAAEQLCAAAWELPCVVVCEISTHHMQLPFLNFNSIQKLCAVAMEGLILCGMMISGDDLSIYSRKSYAYAFRHSDSTYCPLLNATLTTTICHDAPSLASRCPAGGRRRAAATLTPSSQLQ